MAPDPNRFSEALVNRILELRDPETGVWTGELSSSALSTALAIVALRDEQSFEEQQASSLRWLVSNQNPDGGWGDTPTSPSNLSTTLIVRYAISFLGCRTSETTPPVALERADQWLVSKMGCVSFQETVKALHAVYRDDRTFAIPILTFIAVCKEEQGVWDQIPPLPFLLALLPQSVYRFFNLNVVSYALPALIAIGMCCNACSAGERGFSLGRLFSRPLLARLQRIQPEHGGYLDAIPLTAFVAVALKRMGFHNHPVVVKAIQFLRSSCRSDGSYPIDSNLRTWVTTLSLRALLTAQGRIVSCSHAELESIGRWIVEKQTRRIHPYTGAKPGGWAWTDCPGGVPDADDTAGALVALYYLKKCGVALDVRPFVEHGIQWLLSLQNHDGGIATFCKGWGRLPFDQSCPDITAHALLAFRLWKDLSPINTPREQRLLSYLFRSQRSDGAWIPLWFGHQEAPDKRNPVIGTARVLHALSVAYRLQSQAGAIQVMMQKGFNWLLSHQHEDGSWGCGAVGTHEETALAIIALKGLCDPTAKLAVSRGKAWIVREPTLPIAQPVGLYFSLLWYHEKMYPLAWSLEALAGEDDVNQ